MLISHPNPPPSLVILDCIKLGAAKTQNVLTRPFPGFPTL